MNTAIYLASIFAALLVTGYAAAVVLDEDARGEDLIPVATAAIICAFIVGSLFGG